MHDAFVNMMSTKLSRTKVTRRRDKYHGHVVIVDGSNIVRSGKHPRLARLQILMESLDQTDDVKILCDANLKYILVNETEKQIYNKMIHDREIYQTPAGRPADLFILKYAKLCDEAGIFPNIISNDKYREFLCKKEHSWVDSEDNIRRFTIIPIPITNLEKVILDDNPKRFDRKILPLKASVPALSKTYVGDPYEQKPPRGKIKVLFISEAPPANPDNYFYNVTPQDGKYPPSRDFFRSLMQGLGLIPVPISDNLYDEGELLNTFLDNNYYLIDTSREPLPKNGKVAIMMGWVNSLSRQIDELNPEKIIFISKSNKRIQKALAEKFGDSFVTDEPISYPGNGNVNRFIQELPSEYRLV